MWHQIYIRLLCIYHIGYQHFHLIICGIIDMINYLALWGKRVGSINPQPNQGREQRLTLGPLLRIQTEMGVT